MSDLRSQSISELVETGISEVAADILVSMVETGYKYDDEYWMWRLEKSGIDEDTAKAYVIAIRNPSLLKEVFE